MLGQISLLMIAEASYVIVACVVCGERRRVRRFGWFGDGGGRQQRRRGMTRETLAYKCYSSYHFWRRTRDEWRDELPSERSRWRRVADQLIADENEGKGDKT